MDRGGRVGHLHRLEDGANPFVGLELLWNTLDHEGSSIEGIHVLGGTEPDAAHAGHGIPVEVDENEDDKGDDISHNDMGPKPGTTDTADCEDEEGVLGRALVDLGIVVDVDGN